MVTNENIVRLHHFASRNYLLYSQIYVVNIHVLTLFQQQEWIYVLQTDDFLSGTNTNYTLKQ